MNGDLYHYEFKKNHYAIKKKEETNNAQSTSDYSQKTTQSIVYKRVYRDETN